MALESTSLFSTLPRTLLLLFPSLLAVVRVFAHIITKLCCLLLLLHPVRLNELHRGHLPS
eukprot:COSAG06_NODE_4957_length_3832_cov_14.437450_4_plen_60_part_00